MSTLSTDPMLGPFVLGKKAFMLSSVGAGAVAAALQAVASSVSSETVSFLIGVATFAGSVIASAFVSGRLVGKSEQKTSILATQVEELKANQKSLADKDAVAMLDRLLTEKIADIKTVVEAQSRERDLQYQLILSEIQKLRG